MRINQFYFQSEGHRASVRRRLEHELYGSLACLIQESDPRDNDAFLDFPTTYIKVMTFRVLRNANSYSLIFSWSQNDFFHKFFELWAIVGRRSVNRVFNYGQVEWRNEVEENLLNRLVSIHELSYEHLVSIVDKLAITCINKYLHLRSVKSDELGLTIDLSVPLQLVRNVQDVWSERLRVHADGPVGGIIAKRNLSEVNQAKFHLLIQSNLLVFDLLPMQVSVSDEAGQNLNPYCEVEMRFHLHNIRMNLDDEIMNADQIH